MSVIERRVHLATTTIPVGVTRIPDFFDIPIGIGCITFYVTYFGGAPTSQIDLAVTWSSDLIGTENARDLVVQNGLTVAQPDGRYSVLQRIRRGPIPGAGNTIVYEIEAAVPGGARRVRMDATGVGTGGTIAIAITGASDCGGAGDGLVLEGGGAGPLPPPLVPAFSNFLIPRTLHLDDGAGNAVTLPPAGAFTTQTPFAIPPGTKKIAFDYVYTRGAAGGRPAFRIFWGNGVEDVRALIIDQNSLAIAGTDGEFNVYEEHIIAPAPVDANPISDKLEYEVPGGESAVVLTAAEWGATATPGDMLIVLTGRG